jgi:hypothetical protein
MKSEKAMKKLLCAILLVICAPALLFGADDAAVNEDELFSDPGTVVESKKYEKENLDADQNKKRIGLSGEILSVNQYFAPRDDEAAVKQDGSEFRPYIIGTIFTDIRLPSDVKGFGNFEALHEARENETTLGVKELFVDFNLGRAVYFRTGKQVLQWGRCYLWNPTDLVNIEKKTFLTKIGSREGTYGLKLHVPFGTKVNMYGFADTNETDHVSEIAGAYKLEFLAGATEMALSVWGKDHYRPVYGYDFSTRLLGIDIVGEASASYGSNTWKLDETGGVLTAERERGRWIPKASIDFGHAFDFNDQPDKIQVNLEFFYNGDGYRDNVFSDRKTYFYDKPVTVEADGVKVALPAGTKDIYLLGNDLYEPNYHSAYYAALFTTVNKFFTSDFSFKLNCISNIEQRSFIVSTGLAYANINDFKAGIEVYTFIGDRYTEYTASGGLVEVLLTAGLVF